LGVTYSYSAGGADVNFMMDDEGHERLRATYDVHHDQLTQIKATYDLTDVFRIYQNILPAP
jgi:Berberine and berberine like